MPVVIPKPANGTDPSPSSTPSSLQGGLSQGQIVGIAVGIVGSLLFAAAVGLFLWYWRRSHRNQQPLAYSKRRAGCCGLFSVREFTQPSPHSTGQVYKEGVQAVSVQRGTMKVGSETYEMDGQKWRGEMGAGHGWAGFGSRTMVEMDGQSLAGINRKM